MTRTYLSTSIRESQRGLLFYSIALHRMTTINIPISERFNELDNYQKSCLNYLINQVAKHQLSFEDYEQGKRAKDINQAIDCLKEVLAAKPERSI